MAKDFSTMENSNVSANPSIHQVSDPSRRVVIQGASMLGLSQLVQGCASMASFASVPIDPTLGFTPIPTSTADQVTVPPGYVATAAFAWGEPVGLAGNMPAFKPDASNSAADQEAQIGMHHDGMHYFPLDGSRRGLLVMNHEYTDDGLLHPDGQANWSAEKVRKSMAAHGVSVLEITRRADGSWATVLPSRYARRITMHTAMELTGPAAGHAMLQTASDPSGRKVLGTLNNCAHGVTPWGTYLTSEENFSFYFEGPDNPDAHQRRWGLRKLGSGYRWYEFEKRFDARVHPNEVNRFGWIVEIDPTDPTMTPVKHTALGRGAHEGAWVSQLSDGRVAVYMGEDAQFEYITKFVSRDAVKPGGYAANKNLLDFGTLYVARFNADGTGQWLPLVAGQGPLTAANGFASQADVVIKTRQAGDLLGATKMDRPEWISMDPASKEIYCTLTNNSRRGGQGFAPVDAANPRTNNAMGQIIQWKEQGDFDATSFTWKHFVLAGDPAVARADAKGNIRGDIFACPDGLWFDARGVMWIQTDVHASVMNKGELTNFGNNMMLAVDPRNGIAKRFLVGPYNCEVTGVVCTPDMRTMFVNIQHPGESPSDRSDPKDPMKFSRWPDGATAQRPRSATVVVRKLDGGIIGT
jgi:uncharacterized protein